MNIPTQHHHLELPEATRSKLHAYQRRIWAIKLAEGALAAVFGLVLSYLVVFILDRFRDTPAWLRTLILVGGATGLAVWFPLKWHRWVWRTRRLEQVARILRRKFPRFGDQLLGIVELVHSDLEQERSEALCRAALRQVDEETRGRDLSNAVPNPRHRHWAWAAGIPLAIALAALLIVPAAGTNALARWLLPWWQTDRYTFAQLNELPDELVVPYGESFTLTARLAEQSAWSPGHASARYGSQEPVNADLDGATYTFQLPPQKEPDALAVSVGDAEKTVQVKPTTRPELTSMMAHVTLPDYLQQAADVPKDVRGGSVSLVRGSRASFEATATRGLTEAAMDGARQTIQGAKLITSPVQVDESTSREFTWQDHLGLSAKEPFVLSINALDDGPPTIVCNKLSRELVVLDEDVLSFQVLAEDDFGVKSVGMEWEGIEDPLRNPHPAKGEKVVSAGGPRDRNVEVTATFSAKREGVRPQSLKVRLYTDDYLPDRERVYSPTYIFHVLSPEEHAIWLTQQLRKWFRQAQDVYEHEQQLHQTNKDLRALPADQIEQPENRRRIETQAAAERANGRRLSALTGAGEALVKQATRNDQFNVATLENWAGMLQSLKDIAENRMPSVADLLKDAANAPAGTAPSQPGKSPSNPDDQAATPRVGVNRDGRSGPGDAPKPAEPSKVPAIVDVESSFNDLDDTEKSPEDTPPPSGGGRLTLPNTVVQGGGVKQENQNPSSPVQQKVDEAVQQQQDLLAEFAKVADELQKILNNLEGSTFVKRLKAASRRQLEVAGDLNNSRMDDFGVVKSQINDRGQEAAEMIAEREVAQSDSVYVIQEDLEAYYNRVQEGKFKTVLNEMKTVQVVSQLRDVAESVQDNLSGQSIAQAEFWSDTLDRWAEQLVGPG